MRTKRQLWRDFVRNGGVLWKGAGELRLIVEVRAIRSTTYPDFLDYPGQVALFEDQLAWSASDGPRSEFELISLLHMSSVEVEGATVSITFRPGNPRSPIKLAGFLADVMANEPASRERVTFRFARPSEAKRLGDAVTRRTDVARERWPLLATPDGT